MKRAKAKPSRYGSLGRRAIGVAILGAIACAFGASTDLTRFFQAYLVAVVFFLGVSSGCLAAMMLYRLTGGVWGIAIARMAHRGSALIPLMGLLFIPIVIELPRLYEWARPDVVEHDEILQQKAPYLNADAFAMRTFGYFVLWSALAWGLRGRRGWRLPGNVSGVGLAAWFMSGTFAGIDWMMSLEPHWYSTTYGAMFVVGEGLSGLAFATLMLLTVSNERPWPASLPLVGLRDLNNLLLAFVMLWTYIAFSQFLIIWYGNLAEEVTWYQARIEGGWGVVALALVAFHFVVPFLALVAGAGKENPKALAWIAGGIFVMHFVDIYWLIMPAFYPGTLAVSWLDVVVPITVGAVWLAAWSLQGDPFANDDTWEAA